MSRLARDIIAGVPVIACHAHRILSSRGMGTGWSKAKERLDIKLLVSLRAEAKRTGRNDPVELKPWQLSRPPE